MDDCFGGEKIRIKKIMSNLNDEVLNLCDQKINLSDDVEFIVTHYFSEIDNLIFSAEECLKEENEGKLQKEVVKKYEEMIKTMSIRKKRPRKNNNLDVISESEESENEVMTRKKRKNKQENDFKLQKKKFKETDSNIDLNSVQNSVTENTEEEIYYNNFSGLSSNNLIEYTPSQTEVIDLEANFCWCKMPAKGNMISCDNNNV